jgi:hypothetical protein
MNRWEKELKTQGGRSIPERPILKKCCFKIPLQKVYWSNRNERWDPTPRAWLRPGLPVVPLPPPAHPWFSKRRTRDGRNGRTGTKFCRSLITQIVLSLRPCPPFSFPFQLSLWYIQQNITLKKLFFRNQAGERRKTAMRCRNGSLAPVWFYITNTQQLI